MRHPAIENVFAALLAAALSFLASTASADELPFFTTSTGGSPSPASGSAHDVAVAVGTNVFVERTNGFLYAGTVTAVTDDAVDIDIGGKIVSLPWSEVLTIRRSETPAREAPVEAKRGLYVSPAARDWRLFSAYSNGQTRVTYGLDPPDVVDVTTAITSFTLRVEHGAEPAVHYGHRITVETAVTTQNPSGPCPEPCDLRVEDRAIALAAIRFGWEAEMTGIALGPGFVHDPASRSSRSPINAAPLGEEGSFVGPSMNLRIGSPTAHWWLETLSGATSGLEVSQPSERPVYAFAIGVGHRSRYLSLRAGVHRSGLLFGVDAAPWQHARLSVDVRTGNGGSANGAVISLGLSLPLGAQRRPDRTRADELAPHASSSYVCVGLPLIAASAVLMGAIISSSNGHPLFTIY